MSDVMEEPPEEPAPKRAKLRLQLKNGHDCIFTEELPKHLQIECSICLCVLDDPNMIDCKCGASFCRPCIQPIMKKKKPCPLCNNRFTAIFPARQLQRTLNSLQVYCSFKEAGCEWVGELGALSEHLNNNIKSDNYRSSGCSYLQLKCCYCSKEFKRPYVLEHETNDCLKRPFKCETCSEFESTFEDVTTRHIKVCPCRLVSCPNDCGVSLQHKLMDDHVASKCPLEIISCSFNYAGCKEKFPRKDMPVHISDNLAVHMSLQAISHRKEIEELKAENKELRSHLRIMPVNIVLNGYTSKKVEEENWYSRPFYTHLRGYKLRLSVSCNGDDEGEGTHISLYVHLMSGKHDDELEWPFQRPITIQLLDQKEGRKHHEYVLTFDDAPSECAVKIEEPIDFDHPGWGTPKFMAHSRLSPRYLVNDSLSFRVS